MDPFFLFMFHFFHAVMSVHCSLVVTCLEKANRGSLVCDVFLCFVTFQLGIPGQVWYSIVSFPDLCLLPYF